MFSPTQGSINSSTAAGQGIYCAGDVSTNGCFNFGLTVTGQWAFGNSVNVPGLNDSFLSPNLFVCSDANRNLTTTCASASPAPLPAFTVDASAAPLYFITPQPAGDGKIHLSASSPLCVRSSALPCGPPTLGVTFEQTFKNICIADSYVCDYYPVTETTGSVLHDDIGSLNGTFNPTLTGYDNANIIGGFPMGMASGERGADFWFSSNIGYAVVTGIPTPAPAVTPEITEFAVVKNCDVNGADSSAYWFFDTFGQSQDEFNGAGWRTFGDTAGGTVQLQYVYGDGSSVNHTASYIAVWAQTCKSHVYMMVWNGPNPGGTSGISYLVDGIPNASINSGGTVSASLMLNAEYSTGCGTGNICYGSNGVVICCVGIAHGALTFPEIQQLQAASGL